MTREFVMLPEFDHNWRDMGFDDNALAELQQQLCMTPDSGAIMQGTGGLRKLRFAFEGRGKSGSARVAYVDFVYYEKIYLITAYPKNEKDNLSPAERATLKKMIEALKDKLRKK